MHHPICQLLFTNYLLLTAATALAQTTPAPQIGNTQSAIGNPTYSFHPVVIGGGGYVTGLTFNTTSSTLFARTDVGSAYRFDTTANSWSPLLDFVPRSNWNDWGISALATDSADPERLYLAAGTYTRPNFANAHLYRSSDAGKTFAITDLPFKLGGNEDGRNSGPRLAIDPANPATLYLGTPNDGLFRSTDMLAIAAGLGLLGLLRADSSYWLQVVPVFLLVGLGSGWVLVTANSTATLGAGADSAVAGAMVMTSQQVGASLGTALLSTFAGTVAAHSDAVHGFNVAGVGAAGFLCVAAVAVYWVLSERSPDHSRWKLPSRSTRL